MLFIAEDDIAAALDRVRKVCVFLKEEKIFLQFFGKFVEGDASAILHMDAIMAVAHPETGDLEDHVATIRKVERAGDGMICLVEAKPGLFRAPRIPIEANDNSLSKNVSYVEMRFGTPTHPRGSLFVVGITMTAGSQQAAG